jgi:ADP-heptose:LPS heptosyltransferase
MIYMRSCPTRKTIIQDKVFFRAAGLRKILCIPKDEVQRLSLVNPQTNEIEPEAQRLARCFAPLGPIDLNDFSFWDLKLSKNEKDEGNRLASLIPSPFLAVNTGGKVLPKDWGRQRWAKMLCQFKEQSNIPGLAIIGASDDRDRADYLASVWGNGAMNYCGSISPRESAALLSNARLFIGHDSGPLHLAQCMGTLSLGLFGSYNKPAQWHPIGSHVSVIHNIKGIEYISVEEVVKKGIEILAAQ